MNTAKRIWGLTGPTGAGKSVVTALLAQRGFETVDADALAHEATAAGSPCLDEIVSAFSPAVLREDGSLDRAALAKRAFASDEARQALNAIVHPYVIARTKTVLETVTAKRIVLDVPLLFESGMDALCDRTIAVLSSRELRRARIMARDGISGERANERMNAQPNDEFYKRHADDILENNGDLHALIRQVDALLQKERCI